MVRKYKGKSLLEFRSDFVVLDIETTGLSLQKHQIIEIGAIKYKNWIPQCKFQKLIKPKTVDGVYVPKHITSITGITNKMLENERNIQEILPLFREFLGDSLVVGYNVNFDINFLYDNFVEIIGQPLTNDFVDVLRYSRKYLKHLEHHRLCDTIEHFNIKNSHAHRALHDSYVTGQAYIEFYKMLKEVTYEQGC